MARPRGAPKPQARNRRPRRPKHGEHLASLTSEVLRLRLQALTLVTTYTHLLVTFLLLGARLNWLNAYKTPPSQRKDLRPWEESRLAASKRARARAKRV